MGSTNITTNYTEIYVQLTNEHELDRVDSIEPIYRSNSPPPSYNQVPSGDSHSMTNVQSTNRALEDPPAYDEVIETETPPPSYDTIFGRVREAHKSSKGVVDYFENIFILLLGTLGRTIVIGITVVIPVCMIAFGSVYIYDCPQGYIPAYLLVGGGFGVFKLLMRLSIHVRDREDQEMERLRQSQTQTLLNCFMLGWFIIGSLWIYNIYEPNYDPARGDYCNETLYVFTYWLFTTVYLALGAITVLVCSVSIISLAIHRQT